MPEKTAAAPKSKAVSTEPIRVRIKRQERPDSAPYWQDFAIPYKAGHNVHSLLTEIQVRPVTTDGSVTSPVTWDAACLEEVCGSCTMRINGAVRQACTALVDSLDRPIVIEPMQKFPVVRDLCVDRSRMFESLKRVRAWVPIDGTYDLGPGPRMSPEEQEYAYALSRCMTCGCCLEACPQVNERSEFIGAAAIGQAVLKNLHPSGPLTKEERVAELMGQGGLVDCGNAQNCVIVCPKEVPLTRAIGDMGRQTTRRMLKDLFWR
jgi:succinate dehydrogenase / fumarate reductase iron-sulfur subunit